MTATSASPQGTFVTVPGDRHSEVARTLVTVARNPNDILVGGVTSLARSRGGRAQAAEQHVTAA